MSSLAAIRARAQDTANREGKPFAVLNLKRSGGALYVVRTPDAGIEQDRAFVEMVHPQANVTEA